MKAARLKLGDVFTIPTGDGRVGIGQVVGVSGPLFYFAVFDSVLEEDEAPVRLQLALQSPLLLLGLSMPAKVKVGDWKVIGKAPVDDRIRLPAYKEAVGFPPKYEVVDSTGTRRRRATDLEAEVLPYRKVVSPMYFEVAFQAHLGLTPWLDAFDAIRPKGGASTADMFGA